jgi:hypothetical protein
MGRYIIVEVVYRVADEERARGMPISYGSVPSLRASCMSLPLCAQ